MALFAGVLLLPVLTNGVADFDQPTTVFRHFQHVRRGEILGGIWRRIAKRLEQPGIDQRGNVMDLAIQHPGFNVRVSRPCVDEAIGSRAAAAAFLCKDCNTGRS